MTDNNVPSMSDNDLDAIEDFANEAPETPTQEEVVKRTVLETWLILLQEVEPGMHEKVSIRNAQRLVSTWPKLDYQDLSTFNQLYFDYLGQGYNVLLFLINEDREVLKNVEHDAEDNWGVYFELLFRWQSLILDWEFSWSADDEDAAANVAAIAEASAFFASQNGLVGHLESIQFEMTEEDQIKLAGRLQEHQSELEGK